MNNRSGVMDALIRISVSVVAAGVGSLLSDAATSKFNAYADKCEAKVKMQQKKENNIFRKLFSKKK